MTKKILQSLIIILILCSDNVTYANSTPNRNYYFNSSMGSDANSGLTEDSPYKTLLKLDSIDLKGGDTIFLANNNTFNGEIKLLNLSGTESNPIVVTNFGTEGELPTINAAGYLAGIHIQNSSNIVVSNLRIIGDGAGGFPDSEATKASQRYGILYETTKDGNYSDIVLDNIQIENVFMHEKGFERKKNEIHTANGTGAYGWGIRFFNNMKNSTLSDIVIKSCDVYNVSHTGIRFSGKKGNISDVIVSDCNIIEVGGPGMQMSGVHDGHLHNNVVNHSGNYDDSRKWGRGSGYWCWGSKNLIVEHNYFANANGPNDSAGAHIDYNNENVIVQYNFSINNAGGFCEVLGNNYNCSYRYNISVNDGDRKIGDQGAKINGYTLVISGYVGDKPPHLGPFHTYIYNNTIFVKEGNPSITKFAKSTESLLIANNIFHIEGEASTVTNGRFAKGMKNVFFENNLFLDDNSWALENHIKDSSPIYGDAMFKNKGGDKVSDYVPTNIELIKDGGIVIKKLPGDKIGLCKGLKVEKDILGNKIKGKPDFGAIELD